MLDFIQNADWSILHWIQEHLRCGALEHLDCGFIRRMEAHIEKEHGFTLDSGRTVLYGLCGRCGKERAQ